MEEVKCASLSPSSFLFNRCNLLIYFTLLAILWLKQTFMVVPLFLSDVSLNKSYNLIQREEFPTRFEPVLLLLRLKFVYVSHLSQTCCMTIPSFIP
jgi:hypothetical protein